MIVGYSPTALDTVNFFLLCAATHRIRYATHLKLFHRIIIGNYRLLLHPVILRLKKGHPLVSSRQEVEQNTRKLSRYIFVHHHPPVSQCHRAFCLVVWSRESHLHGTKID